MKREKTMENYQEYEKKPLIRVALTAQRHGPLVYQRPSPVTRV